MIKDISISQLPVPPYDYSLNKIKEKNEKNNIYSDSNVINTFNTNDCNYDTEVIASDENTSINKLEHVCSINDIELFVSLFVKGDMEDALSVLSFSVNGVLFNISAIVSALISFIITGFVLFLIVKSVNRAKELTAKTPEEEAEATYTSEDYLKEIRDLLQENATKK